MITAILKAFPSCMTFTHTIGNTCYVFGSFRGLLAGATPLRTSEADEQLVQRVMMARKWRLARMALNQTTAISPRSNGGQS